MCEEQKGGGWWKGTGTDYVSVRGTEENVKPNLISSPTCEHTAPSFCCIFCILSSFLLFFFSWFYFFLLLLLWSVSIAVDNNYENGNTWIILKITKPCATLILVRVAISKERDQKCWPRWGVSASLWTDGDDKNEYSQFEKWMDGAIPKKIKIKPPLRK